MPEQFQPPPANVYAVVHRALYWGMVLSTVLFALGVIGALRHPVRIPLGPAFTQPWPATLRGALALDPVSLMLAATMVLILTPVVRVALALAAFWRDRDYKFVAITAAVLGVIVLTVILGRLGLR